MAYLEIRRDGEPTREVAVTAEEVTAIGRHPACGVRLEHDGVPDIAARVSFDGTHFRIASGPDEAIRVNGDRMTKAKLTAADVVLVGPYQLRFKDGEPDAGERSVVFEKAPGRDGGRKKAKPEKDAKRRVAGAEAVDDLPVAMPVGSAGASQSRAVEEDENEPPRPRPPSRRGKTRPGEEDLVRSPHLLTMLGVTAGLLVAAVAIYFVIGRETARGLIMQADADYDAGRFSAAISGYESFLVEHPRDGRTGGARLRLGLARIERATDAVSPDYAAAAEELTRVSAASRDAGLFEESAETLYATAERLTAASAARAAETAEPTDLDAAERVFVVYDRLTADAAEPRPRRGALDDALARAREAVRVTDRIDRVIGEVAAAADASAFRDAHALLDALVRTERLSEAAAAKVAAVRDGLVASEAAAVAEIPAEVTAISASVSGVTFLDPMPVFVASSEAMGGGAAVVVVGSEAVYGLDPATGRPRWARDSAGAMPFAPIPLGGTGDGVLVGLRDGRLLASLRRADGAPLWESGLPAAVSGPPFVGSGGVFAVVDEREVWRFDASTGRPLARRSFPDELLPTPALTGDGRFLVVAGRDDVTFTLAPDTLELVATTHTGQRDLRGATPRGAGRVLLWAESAGRPRVRSFLVGDDGRLAEMSSVSLPDEPTAAPVLWGDVLYVPGGGGTVTAVRVSDDPAGATLTRLAAYVAAEEGGASAGPMPAATRLALSDRPAVWVAADALRPFRLEAGRFGLLGGPYHAEPHVARPVVSGDVVVSTRLVGPGGRVAFGAVDPERRRTLWETRTPAKVVAAYRVGEAVVIVNEAGERYRLPSGRDVSDRFVPLLDTLPDYDAKRHGRVAAVPTGGASTPLVATGPETAVWVSDGRRVGGPYRLEAGRPTRAVAGEGGRWLFEIDGRTWRLDPRSGTLDRSDEGFPETAGAAGPNEDVAEAAEVASRCGETVAAATFRLDGRLVVPLASGRLAVANDGRGAP